MVSSSSLVHTRRHGRRVAAAATAAILAGVACVIAATPASADYNVFADQVGEWGTTPASDVLAYGVDLTDGVLSFAFITSATPSVPLPGSAGVIVDVEVDGDQSTDYKVFMNDGGRSWSVLDADSFALVCNAVGSMTDSGAAFVAPATCFGSPAKVKVAFWVSAGGGFDFTPDDALRAFSPATVSGPDLPPTDAAAQQVVYRFWSPRFGNAHFFTTNEAEAADVARYDDNWTFEGSAFGAMAASGGGCTEGSAVYRFYSPVFQSHFYTQNADEKEHIVATDRNWSYEGIAYCAYPTPQPGTVALHRFWSPGFGKHFFTADQGEAEHIIAVDRNWEYEGIAYYVLPLA